MAFGNVSLWGEFLDNLLACFNLAEDLRSITCETQVSRNHLRRFKNIPLLQQFT